MRVPAVWTEQTEAMAAWATLAVKTPPSAALGAISRPVAPREVLRAASRVVSVVCLVSVVQMDSPAVQAQVERRAALVRRVPGAGTAMEPPAPTERRALTELMAFPEAWEASQCSAILQPMEPTALPAEAATVAGAEEAVAAELLIVIPTGAVEVAAVEVGAEALEEELGDRRAVRLRFIFRVQTRESRTALS